MRNKTKAEKMRQQKHLLGLTESNLVRLVELGGQRVAAVATSSSAAAAGDRATHVYKRALRSTFGPSIVFHNHVEKHSCSRVFFLSYHLMTPSIPTRRMHSPSYSQK